MLPPHSQGKPGSSQRPKAGATLPFTLLCVRWLPACSSTLLPGELCTSRSETHSLTAHVCPHLEDRLFYLSILSITEVAAILWIPSRLETAQRLILRWLVASVPRGFEEAKQIPCSFFPADVSPQLLLQAISVSCIQGRQLICALLPH